jgi:zinc protease
MQGMTAMPMSGEELTRAKDFLANSLPAAFETSAAAVNNFSALFIYDLGLDYYTSYAQQINAVTADQALDVARRYVVPNRMVVVAVGDRKAIEADLQKLNLGTVEIRDAEGQPAR